MTPAENQHRKPVLVVGAGPVGLTLSLLLDAQGISCILIDKHREPTWQSRAIGLTPPSLNILHKIGAAEAVRAAGIAVHRAYIHDDRGVAGVLDFDRLPEPHAHIISLPQSETLRLLHEVRSHSARIDYRPGWEYIDSAVKPDGIRAHVRCNGVPCEETIEAGWVVGCDGRYSTVRRTGDFSFSHHVYRPRFVMADYEDGTDWGSEAHIYFTSRGSLEAFPLPGNRRRYVALLPETDPDDPGAFLDARIRQWTPQKEIEKRVSDVNVFQPERLLTDRFVKHRILLAGDAAHVMSPIGGHGMNTGLGDAEYLADRFREWADRGSASWTMDYDRDRRRIFRIASRRAALGMWFGTRTGRTASALRSRLIRGALLRPGPSRLLARHYAMLSDPLQSSSSTPAERSS